MSDQSEAASRSPERPEENQGLLPRLFAGSAPRDAGLRARLKTILGLPAKRLSVRGVAVAVLAPGLITALAQLEPIQNEPGMTALYVVGVAVASLVSGLWAGLLASVLSFLAVKFVFAIEVDTSGIAELVAFLVTSVFIAQLVARQESARLRAQRAVKARDELLLALAASEERHRALAEVSSQSVWYAQTAPEDPPVGRSLPTAGDEPQSSPSWLDSIHPADRDRVVTAWQAAVESGEYFEQEYRVRDEEGGYRHLATRAAPVEHGTEAVREWIGASADITDVRRAEDRRAVQYAVTRVLADAATLAEATPRVVEAVCQSLAWDVGAIWQVDERSDVLRCLEIGHVSGDVGAFESVSRQLTFARGVGLPGRVWESGEPVWVADVLADPNFPRAPVARQANLHAAFAFPIRVRRRVAGVLEFFSREIQEPDEDLLNLMASIGLQIGHFMERKQNEEAVAESELRKGAILESALDCVISMDREGRIIDFNPAAERTFGYSRDDAVGQELASLIIPPELRDEHRRGLRHFLATGVGPYLGRRLEVPAVRADGSEFVAEVSITSVDLPAGPLFTGYLRDVTDARRHEKALAFTAEASQLLAGSLHQEWTLRRLARLCVPRLADWCAIETMREDGELDLLAVEHVDAGGVELVKELRRKDPLDPTAEYGAAAAVRKGESQLLTDIPETLLAAAARDDEHAAILGELGLRSAMVVPLVARGRTLGAITFVSAESGRRYDRDDLALAEDLAQRAALAVDNARLYQERSHVARTLQRSLLPQDLPEIPGVEVAVRYRAAGEAIEVGGDFYDVFEAGENAWAIVIGDVCGKGPDAAALTGLARHTIRARAINEPSPSNVLLTLNEAILRQYPAATTFLSAVYARLDLDADDRTSICLSCGGHPHPILVTRDGRTRAVGSPGSLVGAFPDPDLSNELFELETGDLLVLFTDGLVDWIGEGAYDIGIERLMSLLRGCTNLEAEKIAERIEESIDDIGSEAGRDDMAFVVLRVVS